MGRARNRRRPAYVDRFRDQVNDDLNMPRALALTWELVKSDLAPAVKKGTIIQFDRVLGLGLADWAPVETVVPAAIQTLIDQRQAARAARQWPEADALRDQILAAGYDIEDTSEGARVRQRS